MRGVCGAVNMKHAIAEVDSSYQICMYVKSWGGRGEGSLKSLHTEWLLISKNSRVYYVDK